MTAKRLILLVCACALAVAGSGCGRMGLPGGGSQKEQTRAQRIEQEEKRLAELQGQIREHETRLQRYETASTPSALYSPVIPAEMYRETYQAAPYQATRDGDRLGAYTHARIDMNDGSVETGEGEQILYQATGSQNLAASYLNGTNAMNPSASARQRQPADPVPARFAGAPVGRSNFSKPLPEEPEEKEKKPWEEGALFAAQAKPSVPNMYAPRPQTEETMWPAGTAMVPPAGTRNTLRAAPSVPKAEVRLPAVPAPVAAPAPLQKPARFDGPEADDEVFSPSMFLGGGL